MPSSRDFRRTVLAMPQSNKPPGEIPNKLTDFCKKYIKTEKAETFDLTGKRRYLIDILSDMNNLIYVIKGRQVGASTFFAADIIHKALLYPRTTHIYMTDTHPHARYFSLMRFGPMLRSTGIAQQAGKRNKRDELVFEYKLPNGSLVLMQSNYDAFTQARSISADFIWLDECQNAELEQIGNLHSAMSRSKHRRLVLAGTTNHQGSVWEEKWLSSSMSEWTEDSEQWVKLNHNSKVSGYLISQTMMPDMTEERLAELRELYSPQQWDTEVVGRFTTGLAQPLTVSEARKCYYKSEMVLPTRINRNNGKVVAALDWAGGGKAFTVLTISQYNPDTMMLSVLCAHKYTDNRATPLANKIKTVITDYTPDAVVADAGGNIEALELTAESHHVQRYKSQGTANDMAELITYNKDKSIPLDTVSKHPMMARTIQRFLDDKIRIPECSDTAPWTIEHVTAEKSETITPKSGSTPYTRYEKMTNRQDDFLQTLMFTEAWIYAQTDPKNPHNFKYRVAGPKHLKRRRGYSF